MSLFEIIITFYLGAVLGSFSTALVYRVPRKQKWWGAERSKCPSCNHVLSFFDLIPIISWGVFRGRCRHCKTKVSVRYPLIELCSALACVGAYVVFGWSYELFFIVAVLPFLIALFLIDLKHMILPNQLVFIVLVIGVVRLFYLSTIGAFAQVSDLFVPYIAGACLYAFLPWLIGWIMTKILKKDSLGFGDVKFFFTSGIWLGLDLLPHFMILSGGGAVFYALILRVAGKGEAFPFGPALIASFYVLLLFQGSFLM